MGVLAPYLTTIEVTFREGTRDLLRKVVTCFPGEVELCGPLPSGVLQRRSLLLRGLRSFVAVLVVPPLRWGSVGPYCRVGW